MIIDYSVTPPLKEWLFKRSYEEDYFRLYRDMHKELGRVSEWNISLFIELLDKEGIDIALIRARDVESTLGKGRKIPNEVCANLVKQYPNRLIGMAGADPLKGKKAVEELEYAIKDLGLKGVDLWPFEYNLYPQDRAYYPIYEKCLELDAIVSIESSMHFNRSIRMDLCRPLYLDYVAVDFPDLKLVGSTPGWPWVSELMGVAWRHPNVFVSIGYIRHKQIGNPLSGYETLLQLGNSVLQDKIIFGSGWPDLPMKRAVEEVRALPLKEDVKQKWLYHNAAKLLKLE